MPWKEEEEEQGRLESESKDPRSRSHSREMKLDWFETLLIQHKRQSFLSTIFFVLYLEVKCFELN